MSPCLYPWNLQKCCAAVWPAVPWARVSGVPLPGPPTITWGQPGRWARSVEARVGSGHQARIPPLMLARGEPESRGLRPRRLHACVVAACPLPVVSAQRNVRTVSSFPVCTSIPVTVS